MKKIGKIFVYILIVLILTILYARFIGTNGLITKEYSMYIEKLPSDFNGMKIVHFSDLHYKRNLTNKKLDGIID